MNFKDYFIYALTLDQHPMAHIKDKVKIRYYNMLIFFLEQLKAQKSLEDTEETLIDFRQKEYRTLLENNSQNQVYTPKRCTLNLWKRDYIFSLFCDLLLITQGTEDSNTILDIMNDYLNFINKSRFDKLIQLLETTNFIDFEDSKRVEAYFRNNKKFNFVKNLIEQYGRNLEFSKQSEKRIIITANMSAGKSTLINALVGKNIARTSQECCTGNICYIYNKPFEDKHIALMTDQIYLDVDYKTLKGYEWNEPIYMISYFNQPTKQRICLIDTPGVNSSINKHHGQITKEALKNEQYDTVLYILNANKLGTEEEIEYLTWIYKNVPEDKILFVLNKLDEFKINEDDIQKSIEGVEADLKQIGYSNPKICPLSAYFAYILKKKHYNEALTEDEEDDLKMYSRKFSRVGYDLSYYYIDAEDTQVDDDFIRFNQKCGMYYLEETLGFISEEQISNIIAI